MGFGLRSGSGYPNIRLWACGTYEICNLSFCYGWVLGNYNYSLQFSILGLLNKPVGLRAKQARPSLSFCLMQAQQWAQADQLGPRLVPSSNVVSSSKPRRKNTGFNKKKYFSSNFSSQQKHFCRVTFVEIWMLITENSIRPSQFADWQKGKACMVQSGHNIRWKPILQCIKLCKFIFWTN